MSVGMSWPKSTEPSVLVGSPMRMPSISTSVWPGVEPRKATGGLRSGSAIRKDVKSRNAAQNVVEAERSAFLDVARVNNADRGAAARCRLLDARRRDDGLVFNVGGGGAWLRRAQRADFDDRQGLLGESDGSGEG